MRIIIQIPRGCYKYVKTYNCGVWPNLLMAKFEPFLSTHPARYVQIITAAAVIISNAQRLRQNYYRQQGQASKSVTNVPSFDKGPPRVSFCINRFPVHLLLLLNGILSLDWTWIKSTNNRDRWFVNELALFSLIGHNMTVDDRALQVWKCNWTIAQNDRMGFIGQLNQIY